MIIRQSTARTFLVGPILDADGVAVTTGPVIGDINLTKNGVVSSAAAAATLTHDHAGKWLLVTIPGNSDTVGILQISLNDGVNDMPVLTCNVVEEAVFDAMYAASAAGPLQSTTAARKLDVTANGEAGLDLDNTSGTLDAAQFGADFLTAAKIADGAFVADNFAASSLDGKGDWNTTTPPTVGAIADQVWDEPIAGHNTKNTTGNYLRNASGGTPVTIHSGTAQAGGANSITLDAGASAVNDVYNGNVVTITAQTGVGQTRKIVNYDGGTKVATVDQDWVTNPDNTSTFDVTAFAGSLVSDEGIAQAGGASTITLASTASVNDDIYNGSFVSITSGTGDGQTRTISDYDGGTKVATVSVAWSVNPDSTSVYAVIPSGADSSDSPTGSVSAPTAAEIADGVWDELLAGHTTADTAGLVLNEWQDGGRLDLILDATLVDTNSLNDTKIPNTLNTSASGNIGIDWANVENPTTAVDLAGTAIQLCDTITTYTNNTPQTGDAYVIVTDGIYGNSAIVTQGNSAWITATSVTVSDKTGFSLVNTGADLVLKSSTFALALADAIWDEVLTGGTHNVATSSGRRLRQLEATVILHEGTADAGAAGYLDLETGVASALDDFYDHCLIVLTGGTGAGQSRSVDSYEGITNQRATVTPNWTTTPDGTTTYSIYAAGETHVAEVHTGAIDAASFAANALAAATFAANSLDGKGDWNTVVPDAAGVAATAAKLLAYVQLLARSDAAIETDNATELTAINANGGAGAGDFSSQTDSEEALRNRGDAAWVTATGFNTSKTGYSLASNGLDSIVVETGLNARQALSILSSSGAGVLVGAATTTIAIAAAGVPATNRITATVDSDGNRSAITLNPPT